MGSFAAAGGWLTYTWRLPGRRSQPQAALAIRNGHPAAQAGNPLPDCLGTEGILKLNFPDDMLLLTGRSCLRPAQTSLRSICSEAQTLRACAARAVDDGAGRAGCHGAGPQRRAVSLPVQRAVRAAGLMRCVHVQPGPLTTAQAMPGVMEQANSGVL